MSEERLSLLSGSSSACIGLGLLIAILKCEGSVNASPLGFISHTVALQSILEFIVVKIGYWTRLDFVRFLSLLAVSVFAGASVHRPRALFSLGLRLQL